MKRLNLILIMLLCSAGILLADRIETEKFTFEGSVELSNTSNSITLQGVTRDYWHFYPNENQFSVDNTNIHISPNFAGKGLYMTNDGVTVGSINIGLGTWLTFTDDGNGISIVTNDVNDFVWNIWSNSWYKSVTNEINTFITNYFKVNLPNAKAPLYYNKSGTNNQYELNYGDGLSLKGGTQLVSNLRGVTAPINLNNGNVGLGYDGTYFKVAGTDLTLNTNNNSIGNTHTHNRLHGKTIPKWANDISTLHYGSDEPTNINARIKHKDTGQPPPTFSVTAPAWPATTINIVPLPNTEYNVAPWGIIWENGNNSVKFNGANAYNVYQYGDWYGFGGHASLYLLSMHETANDLYVVYTRIIPYSDYKPGTGEHIWGGFNDGTNGCVATKTFLIKHPNPELEDKKILVHSCIESPYADLVYRGEVKLNNGIATINIDKQFNMSEGTFVALTTNPQYFLQNHSGWDKVRGNVKGNILSIESENTSSSDTINWMVIAERNDPTIKSDYMTDENGRLIVEFDQVELVADPNVIPPGTILRKTQDGAYFKPNVKNNNTTTLP